MRAKELLVDYCGEWKSIESGHAYVVEVLRILACAFNFEGEIGGEIAAFVISSQ